MSNGQGKDIELRIARFIEDAGVNPCDVCAKGTTERAALSWEKKDSSKGVDYACESCRAVLEVAQGLLDNKVEDENEIITTIALAANAGLSWIEAANQSSAVFGQEYPGLQFSREVDGMPLFAAMRASPIWARSKVVLAVASDNGLPRIRLMRTSENTPSTHSAE